LTDLPTFASPFETVQTILVTGAPQMTRCDMRAARDPTFLSRRRLASYMAVDLTTR